MAIKDEIVYLCYDAGGLHIIDCTDPSTPLEIGRWVNPDMHQPINFPRAYNNIIVEDNTAFISVDYAGMEILDISDPTSPSLTSWWNPLGAPANNWFTSPMHTNEIAYDPNCKKVFMSTGKSDMIVVDVTNVMAPDSCNYFGGVENDIGTWGISRYEDKIFLSYICVPFPGIPFPSDWTGVKILKYTPCTSSVLDFSEEEILVYPNPASDFVTVISETNFESFQIYNEKGQIVKSRNTKKIQIGDLEDGLYFIRMTAGKSMAVKKFIKM